MGARRGDGQRSQKSKRRERRRMWDVKVSFLGKRAEGQGKGPVDLAFKVESLES